MNDKDRQQAPRKNARRKAVTGPGGRSVFKIPPADWMALYVWDHIERGIRDLSTSQRRRFFRTLATQAAHRAAGHRGR